MNIKRTKQEAYWLTLIVLSIGTLSGCEYCAPVMLVLLVGNVIYKAIRTLIEALVIQTLA
ncbi:MAG: hypothetical protein IMF04_00860 [Proteobacteria bacterium]|nr:hypothetical protein [Pseudomonadota bacterium]